MSLSVAVQPVRYQLKKPIFTAASSLVDRTGAVVSITDGEFTGWGEALPIPGWPNGDVTVMLKAIRTWLIEVTEAGLRHLDPSDLPLPAHPVAAAALDCARFDLIGQRTGNPIAHLIAARSSRSIAAQTRTKPVGVAISVNGLVTGRSAVEAAESAKAHVRRGIKTLKVKVGVDHISADVQRLEAIREGIGNNVAIRLDANRAWELKEAAENLPKLAAFDIEYIEEPVRSLVELRQLRGDSPIPLYVDELVSDPLSAKKILIGQLADGLVLKPATLGSLVATRELAERALAAGLGVTLTNVLDSGVGITAAMHVAAAVDGQINACGFATGDLFDADPAPPPRVIDGLVHMPKTPGLGVTPRMPTSLHAFDL